MATCKAFLSNQADRIEFSAWGSAVDWPAWAEREARAILAASEPWARWDGDERQPLAVGWNEETPAARLALREALAAFVGGAL